MHGKLRKDGTFERSVPEGMVGLLHLTLGFLGTVLATAKVFLYGPAAPFEFGIFLGLFNYLYQFTSIALWFSGIGILRARPWGRTLAGLWALLVLLLIPTGQWLRLSALGLLAPDLGWGNPLVMTYAMAVALAVWRKQLALGGRRLLAALESGVRSLLPHREARHVRPDEPARGKHEPGAARP